MAAGSSKKVVIAALVGNALIAATKFVAAAATGSSAMFSETVHSVVDTGNQLLMLYGMGRASRPADRIHPFGYGRELYFWAFVVAILLFATGAGVSLYEGIAKVQHPEPLVDAYVNYLVLGLAIVFEAGAFAVAFRELRARRGRHGYLTALRVSKDPALFTVLMEDSAALAGLLVALAGVALAEGLDLPVLDGVASIGIGLILAAVAIFLAYETKGLLIGEAAAPRVVADIRRIVGADASVERIHEVLTTHLGPDDVLLNLRVDFASGLSSDQVEDAVAALEGQISAAHPQVRRIFIEARRHARLPDADRPAALPGQMS